MSSTSEFNHLIRSPQMPLFNDSSPRERYFHYGLAAVTSIFVFVTLCLAFFYNVPPDGRHIYFSFVLILMCFFHYILIHWYRQGDVDPKFRMYIYGNTAIIIMFSVSGISYFTQKPGALKAVLL